MRTNIRALMHAWGSGYKQEKGSGVTTITLC